MYAAPNAFIMTDQVISRPGSTGKWYVCNHPAYTMYVDAAGGNVLRNDSSVDWQPVEAFTGLCLWYFFPQM
jgi:hypothetical protein